MSKFAHVATTSHALSIAAMEEASRVGQRIADIDHLFLALTVDGHVAGQVLRDLGITLESAWRAVSAQHAAQLASLGVDVEVPAPGRIVFHETGGYAWTERSIAIFRNASNGDKRGDAAAVLRELVSEPSGLIEAVLNRLGTTPEVVIEHLNAAERGVVDAQPANEVSDRLSGTVVSFAPAPLKQVWQLLADPDRMPQWDLGIAAVDGAPAVAQVGDVWMARSSVQRPDGKLMRARRRPRIQRVELTAREDDRVIEWRYTYPEYPQANARRIRIELRPVAGGTQVRILLAWERNPVRPRRRVMGILSRPMVRYAIWSQLSTLAGAISRVFR